MFPSFQVLSRPLKSQHGENPHLILSSVASKFSCFVASWQSVKKAPFVFSWANSTTLPNLQQESLHVRRLLVQPEQQLLHVERKWNQTRCLPTAQNHLLREQKDHSIQTIHPSGTPHETRRLYFPREDNKEDLGLQLLYLNVPDSPGHPWLSSKAWDSESPSCACSGQHWEVQVSNPSSNGRLLPKVCSASWALTFKEEKGKCLKGTSAKPIFTFQSKVTDSWEM